MKATTVAVLAVASAATTFAHPIFISDVNARDIAPSDLSDLEARKVNWGQVGKTAFKVGKVAAKLALRDEDGSDYLVARDVDDLEARKVNWGKVGRTALGVGKFAAKLALRDEEGSDYLVARDVDDLEARKVNWGQVGKTAFKVGKVAAKLALRDEDGSDYLVARDFDDEYLEARDSDDSTVSHPFKNGKPRQKKYAAKHYTHVAAKPQGHNGNLEARDFDDEYLEARDDEPKSQLREHGLKNNVVKHSHASGKSHVHKGGMHSLD